MTAKEKNTLKEKLSSMSSSEKRNQARELGLIKKGGKGSSGDLKKFLNSDFKTVKAFLNYREKEDLIKAERKIKQDKEIQEKQRIAELERFEQEKKLEQQKIVADRILKEEEMKAQRQVELTQKQLEKERELEQEKERLEQLQKENNRKLEEIEMKRPEHLSKAILYSIFALIAVLVAFYFSRFLVLANSDFVAKQFNLSYKEALYTLISIEVTGVLIIWCRSILKNDSDKLFRIVTNIGFVLIIVWNVLIVGGTVYRGYTNIADINKDYFKVINFNNGIDEQIKTHQNRIDKFENRIDILKTMKGTKREVINIMTAQGMIEKNDIAPLKEKKIKDIPKKIGNVELYSDLISKGLLSFFFVALNMVVNFIGSNVIAVIADCIRLYRKMGQEKNKINSLVFA